MVLNGGGLKLGYQLVEAQRTSGSFVFIPEAIILMVESRKNRSAPPLL